MTKLTTQRQTAETTVLLVRLGTDLLALPIERVEEVLPALPIESVPQCPRFVRGVVFVRGHLIPVLSAAERLGIADYRRPDEPHIVCLKQNDRLIGVEFDEALDLIRLPSDDWLTAEQLGAKNGFLRGVVDHDGQIIRLLDPDRIVENNESSALEQLPRAREESIIS